MVEAGMQDSVENVPIFGFQIDGGEIVLLLAIILVVFGASRLRKFMRGLGKGMRDMDDGVFNEAIEAGKSVGGILGKPAAEALTPDNQTAELYDPAAFRRGQKRDGQMKNDQESWLGRLWRGIRHFVGKLLNR
jgi:TatA/E family protein of Tat protein translocase